MTNDFGAHDAAIWHTRNVVRAIRDIHAYWAELLFVLWAMARHPQHPQFMGEVWVPPGWRERDAARVQADRPTLPR